MTRVSAKTRSLAGKSTVIPIRWLGWDRPILHATVDFLIDGYCRGRTWDMQQAVCVLPSSMAGRRLTELLAETAHARGLVLRPPEILTSGRLPELLYQARFPFASDLEQILGWTKVLRAMPTEVLKPLLIEVPSSSTTAPWVELAELMAGLHRELSSDLTMFDDVIQMLVNDAADESEVERWRVLAKVQRAYLDELHRAELWDIQTARRYAIDKKEPKTDRDIVIVGAVDLNRAQRAFLEAVHDRATILIGAPETWREGFDEFGTLKSGFWEYMPVEFDRDQLVTRPTSDDAAVEVARQLAYLGAEYSPQEITIGVPDTTLIPVMTEQLQRSGVSARYGAGLVASLSSPVRLLQAIAEFIESGSYESFAALVRLPTVFDYLTKDVGMAGDFIEWLDVYYATTLLRSVHVAQWPTAAGRETVQRVLKHVQDWLAPLRLPAMTLAKWAGPLDQVLAAVFRTSVVDVDSASGSAAIDACGKVSEAITQLGDLPETLLLDATFKEALAWIVRQIDKETIPPLRDPESIEMIGWLDLSLDDAPVLLLTGIHDGTVPESVNGDAFLPNRIRTKLGLMDNARRYARDCYALHVHIRSRKHLRVITNHLNLHGEPQTPSRLLLAVNPEQLARRVMTIVKPTLDPLLPSVMGRQVPRPIQSDIPIPQPSPGSGGLVQAMSPTDFKVYIDCPYRFYLSKIRRLTSINDRKLELEANDFGNLLHDTLALLKDNDESKTSDATRLRAWLFAQLNALAEARYGKQPPPVVLVQLEQARQRLAAFANHQARRAAQGWTIWKTECSVKLEDGLKIEIDGQPSMPIIGRIDRIDFHPVSESYAIWDYKTADRPTKPLPAHWTKSAGWKQLQLPLYREMASVLGVAKKPTVGYINLPRATDKTEFITAEFTDDLQIAALDAAREVVRKIRENIFWPPNYTGIAEWDIFKGLCQHQVARRWELPLEELVKAELQSASPNRTDPPRAVSIRVPSTVPPKKTDIDLPPDSLALSLDTTAGTAPVEWFDRTLIEASAGTGKTFSLAIRMIRLLFAKQAPDGILATTFTRKAAGEILERVLQLLAEAIESKRGLEVLMEQLKPLKIDRKSCIHHLSNLCTNLHRLRVNTLDGFYSQLARTFAIELKLPPGWTLADEFQSTKLRDQAITRLFENHDRSQLRALISQLNRGEAKRGVRAEVHQTIETGYSLFQATKPEAWSNLVVPKEPDSALVSEAIDKIAQTQMKNVKFADARDKLLDAFSQSAWDTFFDLTLVGNAKTTGTFSRVELPRPFIEGVTVLVEYALSNELASRRAQSEAAYELLANYHLQYETVKRAQRLVTFSDVSQRLAEWFRSHASQPADRETGEDHEAEDAADRASHLAKVGYRLDSRIDHLLLDEFQDTSPAQDGHLFPGAVRRRRSRRRFPVRHRAPRARRSSDPRRRRAPIRARNIDRARCARCSAFRFVESDSFGTRVQEFNVFVSLCSDDVAGRGRARAHGRALRPSDKNFEWRR